MKKYQIENSIGNGNFSTVYKAIDVETRKPCAIKLMKTHPKIALRQAQLLKKFKHPNVISILDFQQNDHESRIVLEQAGINTLELYQAHSYGLREEQVKCILFQAALGLAYVHSFGIVHRDVKPENLLIDKKNASVKIIDFGLAIDESTISTDYIATRWYRAPENLLGTKEYSSAIDVFSLGCVIVELYLGSPLFPGANNLDQVFKIFNILGYPSQQNWSLGYEKMIELGIRPSSQQRKQQMDLKQILSPCDSGLIDLITKMLQLNPINRISCQEIIKHDYFKDIKLIVPPTVYSRFQQDYLARKQISFKGIGYQKNSRLNSNSPRNIGSPASYGVLASKPQHHKQISLHRSNQCYKEVLRKKKSASIDSVKFYHQQDQGTLLVKENEDSNRREAYRSAKKMKSEIMEKNSHNMPYILKRKSKDYIICDDQPKRSSIIEKNQRNEESEIIHPVEPSQLKVSLTHPILEQEINKSKTSTGDSTRLISHHSQLPTLNNVPVVKTHLLSTLQKKSQSFFDEEGKIQRKSPLMKSTPGQQSTARHYHQMNKYSVTQGTCQEQNSFQADKNLSNIEQKLGLLTRRNRVNNLNAARQPCRLPLSPQHQFQHLNLYRNQHHPNARKPQDSTHRTHLSPTIHHFQSPPPTMLGERKSTVISPQNSHRMGRNSPERGLHPHPRHNQYWVNPSTSSNFRKGEGWGSPGRRPFKI